MDRIVNDLVTFKAEDNIYTFNRCIQKSTKYLEQANKLETNVTVDLENAIEVQFIELDNDVINFYNYRLSDK